MKQKQKKVRFSRAVRLVFTAAVICSMLAISAFAYEEIAGWVKTFFVTFSGELSDEQGDLLAEKEQVILESQTVEGWTMELKSTITDGNVGIIVFDLKGPEGSNAWKHEFGNMINHREQSVITWPEGVSRFGSWGTHILDDGDGLDSTKRMIMHIDPDEAESTVDPFGHETKYRINFENLYNGGTCDESGNISGELAVEGAWEFTVSFQKSMAEPIELLTEPVTVTGYFSDLSNPELEAKEAPVLLTSVELRDLTVTLHYENSLGMPEFGLNTEGTVTYPVVVLKDGSTIELMSYGVNSFPYQTMVAKEPIVAEQVDYLQMADGTVIPMPE